jgi:hypothetical protein
VRLHRGLFLLVAAVVAAAGQDAHAATYGTCGFNTQTSRYAGTVEQTAACLLRKVRAHGSGSDAQQIPSWLGQRMSHPVSFTLPQLQAFLQRENIPSTAVSGRMATGDAQHARYFVIHDTSSPTIETSGTVFPPNINDATYAGNSLRASTRLRQQVNLLITRDGRSLALTDWAASRAIGATKLENRAGVQRRVFVHVENIQPRIEPPGSWGWRAPVPGFGPAQERRLALAYMVASLRAGRWLIPAFHFNVDQGVGEAHDDPQNFDLNAWASRLSELETAILTGSNP